MIRHDAALTLAATAIDFDLASAERSELTAHLATCPACARTVRGLHADAAALASLPLPALDPARADAIVGRVLAPRRGLASGSLRLVLVAALVGLLAIGSFLVGAEFLRRAQQDDLSVLPAPSASVAPQPSEVLPEPTWATVAVPAREADDRWGVYIHGVTVGRDGMVAYGRFHCRDDETDCRLTMLWSADGRAWTPVPTQPSLTTQPYRPTSGPELGIISVVEGSSGWVAVGRVADPVPSGEPFDVQVATWTSDDGRTWVRQPPDIDFADAEPAAIVALPNGYLIVGADHAAGPADGPTWAVAWVSPDGRTWTRTKRSDALAAGWACDTTEWPTYGGMDDVVVLEDGSLVAVGTRVAEPTAPGEACPRLTMAWRSDDGVIWARVADFPEQPAGGLRVATNGQRIVAATVCEEAGCATVTASDGRTWTTLPGLEEAAVADIALDGDEVVLLGGTDIGPDRTRVWRLPPGGDWTAEALPEVRVGTVRALAIDVRDRVAAIVGWAEELGEGVPASFSLIRR